MFRAKYYGFWQTELGSLIQRVQHLTLYILVALAIASGVEGSSYDDPSSIALAQKLAQAYSIICTFLPNENTNLSSHGFPSIQHIPMGCFVGQWKSWTR